MAVFKCCVCGKVYTAKSSLKVHMRIHTKKPFLCTVCNKNFVRSTGLKIHMRSHTKVKPYVCLPCNKAFRYLQSLSQHMMTHTGEKRFGCTHCKKQFNERSQLNKHMLTHTDPRSFVSSQECGKEVTHKKSHYRHATIHVGSKPFECDECRQSFIRKADFDKHCRTHRVSPFVCFKCNIGYKRMHGLLDHIRKLHSTQRKFGCGFCSKVFEDSTLLAKHVQFYFAYRYCDSSQCKRYSESGDVDSKSIESRRLLDTTVQKGKNDQIIIEISEVVDVNDVENSVENHPSNKCVSENQKDFSLMPRKGLKNSKRPISYNCSVCGKVFKFLTNFKKHLEKHKGVLNLVPNGLKFCYLDESGALQFNQKLPICQICGTAFPLLKNLEYHSERNSGSSIPMCRVCTYLNLNVEGNSSKYLRKNSMKKCLELDVLRKGLYSCHMCGESFLLHKSLLTHIKTHTVDKPFICSQCGKGFKQIRRITMHLELHDIRSFHCVLCNKRFKDSNSYKIHMKIHETVDQSWFPQISNEPGRDVYKITATDTTDFVCETADYVKIEIDAEVQDLCSSEEIVGDSENGFGNKDIKRENENIDLGGLFLPSLSEYVTIEVKE